MFCWQPIFCKATISMLCQFVRRVKAYSTAKFGPVQRRIITAEIYLQIWILSEDLPKLCQMSPTWSCRSKYIDKSGYSTEKSMRASLLRNRGEWPNPFQDPLIIPPVIVWLQTNVVGKTRAWRILLPLATQCGCFAIHGLYVSSL